MRLTSMRLMSFQSDLHHQQQPFSPNTTVCVCVWERLWMSTLASCEKGIQGSVCSGQSAISDSFSHSHSHTHTHTHTHTLQVCLALSWWICGFCFAGCGKGRLQVTAWRFDARVSFKVCVCVFVCESLWTIYPCWISSVFLRGRTRHIK